MYHFTGFEVQKWKLVKLNLMQYLHWLVHLEYSHWVDVLSIYQKASFFLEMLVRYFQDWTVQIVGVSTLVLRTALSIEINVSFFTKKVCSASCALCR